MRNAAMLAGLIAAAATLAACSQGKPKPPQDSPPGAYAIGQPVTVGGAEITIETVTAREEVGKPGARKEAEPGNVLIILRESVKNVGDRPLTLAGTRLGLIDPQGQIHYPDAAFTAAYLTEAPPRPRPGTLAPGASEDEAPVFQVSAQSYPRGWEIMVGDRTRRVELK